MNVLIVLGCMNLDLALMTEQPAALTDKSSVDENRDINKWDCSNRTSLMIMKHSIPESFRGAVFDKVTTANKFLAEIEETLCKER